MNKETYFNGVYFSRRHGTVFVTCKVDVQVTAPADPRVLCDECPTIEYAARLHDLCIWAKFQHKKVSNLSLRPPLRICNFPGEWPSHSWAKIAAHPDGEKILEIFPRLDLTTAQPPAILSA